MKEVYIPIPLDMCVCMTHTKKNTQAHTYTCIPQRR